MDPYAVFNTLDLADEANLLGLNVTQEALLRSFVSSLFINQTQAIVNAESHTFVSSLIPFILESFALGVVCVAASLLAYSRLRNKYPSRYIILLAVAAGVFATHWALAYRAIMLFSPLLLDLGLPDIEGPVCETVLFGILTSLVFFAFILFSKARDINARSSWTLSRCFPFGIVAVMYIAAATHWGLGLSTVVLPLDKQYTDLTFLLLEVVSVVALSLCIVCGDAVVLWRACVIWMNRRSIVLLSAFLIFATAASSITHIAFIVYAVLSDSSIPGAILVIGPYDSLLTTPGIVSLAFSIFSNVFATLAIAYKAWRHRVMVRKHLTTGSRKLITEKIMCIFIESGAVYIFFWILYIIATTATAVFGTTAALNTYLYSMIQLTAIYPTLIIILVFLEKKAHFARDLTIIARLPAAHMTIATMIHSMPTQPSEVLVIGPDEVVISRSADSVNLPSSGDPREDKEDGGGSLRAI